MPTGLTGKRGLPLVPPPPPLPANGKALYYVVWWERAPWARREYRKAAGSSYYAVDRELAALGRELWGGGGTVGAASLQSGAGSSECRAAPRLGRVCPGTLAPLPAREAAGSRVLEGRPKAGQGQGGGHGDRDLVPPSLPLP